MTPKRPQKSSYKVPLGLTQVERVSGTHQSQPTRTQKESGGHSHGRHIASSQFCQQPIIGGPQKIKNMAGWKILLHLQKKADPKDIIFK